MPSECPKCGAPRQLERVLCSFCHTPFDEEEARRATRCPKCKDLFSPTTQKCPKCDIWLVVHCVFCGGLSPYTRAACDTCGELFAGAAERKAAAQHQAQWAPPIPAAPPAPMAPAFPHTPAFGADAWGGGDPEPPAEVGSLFSAFGTGPAEPPPAEPAAGWDLDAWTGPKRGS